MKASKPIKRKQLAKKAIEAKKRTFIKNCFHEKKQEGLDVRDPQNIAICMSGAKKIKERKITKVK